MHSDHGGSASQRIQSIQSPIIPVVGRLIRDNPGTISLGQGVVSYGPPDQAVMGIKDFLAEPENHKYGPVEGMPALRDAIAVKLAEQNGIECDPRRHIVVTAGANMGFLNAVLAICEPGDEVILPLPYFFNHQMAVMMAGCRAVPVPTDDRYHLRLERIEQAITPRTRAVVTVSPNNPTGAVYSEEELRGVNRLCRERGLFHISDEAYEEFTYEAFRHFSPGAIPGANGHTISLFSLSKGFGFASWRIGYMVVPGALAESISKIQDTNLICAPIVCQYAALGALQIGRAYPRGKLPAIAQVRETVLASLSSLGEQIAPPVSEGAFYVLVRVRSNLSSMQACERLIREHRVAAIPGNAFGLDLGCYLRVSYGALSRDTAAEGLGRLVEGVRALSNI
jgi:aspartate/methionine/tyrosine aminotransferase